VHRHGWHGYLSFQRQWFRHVLGSSHAHASLLLLTTASALFVRRSTQSGIFIQLLSFQLRGDQVKLRCKTMAFRLQLSWVLSVMRIPKCMTLSLPGPITSWRSQPRSPKSQDPSCCSPFCPCAHVLRIPDDPRHLSTSLSGLQTEPSSYITLLNCYTISYSGRMNEKDRDI
jgi:hypothetical protein